MPSNESLLSTFLNQLDEHTDLIAVSKEQPLEKISNLYELGQRDFGENKAQALQLRYESLPKDIRWHMIGHLQRNKVRLIAPFVHLIQSVDSLGLLQQIEIEGKKQNRLLRCLLQIHIATQEEHKHGLKSEELSEILDPSFLDTLSHVEIKGLMGMSSHTTHEALISSEFQSLQRQFEALRKEVSHPRIEMRTLSMGMSNDYRLALHSSSNMLRIGSAIFGPRPSQKTSAPSPSPSP